MTNGLLRGIYRLWVKVSICVREAFSLQLGHAARVNVVRRQSPCHGGQALQTQPE